VAVNTPTQDGEATEAKGGMTDREVEDEGERKG
jgi:hypothetical protein